LSDKANRIWVDYNDFVKPIYKLYTIMRNIIVIISFLISLHSLAQNGQIIAYQKDRFKLAISFFEKSEFEKAADLFSYVNKLNPNNELGQFALKKLIP
jgi:hypothetical protein